MKNLIIITAAFFILLGQANAQFKYGPRVSAGLSTLGAGNAGIGMQAGIFVNAELKDRIGVQGEVLYSFFNGNQKSAGSTTERVRYNFSYINIPIYGYFPLSQHITLLVGPQLGVVNKATSRETIKINNSDTLIVTDISGAEGRLGLAAGLDFNMQSPLRFGLRFSTSGGEAFLGKSSFVGVTMAYYMDW